MLIRQLYFSPKGLVTKGNSCVKIFPPSVLKLVSWAKLIASSIPSLVQVVCPVQSIMRALGSDHVGAQQARGAEAALLTSKKTQTTLSCSWEVSFPWQKRMCSLGSWGRLKSVEKRRPEILSFVGGVGCAMRNQVFLPQLGLFSLQIKPSTTWLFLWSDAEMGELIPL